VTVIPVAKVRWGFGGGGGSRGPGSSRNGNGSGPAAETGSGGGGGATASPAGFIKIRDGEAEFVPIHDPAAYWPLALAGGVGGWLILRGLRSLWG
jgi:uncharacterized spore protein YtfJ